MTLQNIRRFLKSVSPAMLAVPAVLALASCLHDDGSTGPAKGLALETPANPDARMNFLTQDLGIKSENISIYVDSVTRDTSYVISPTISEADAAKAKARKLSLRSGALALKLSTVDTLMSRSKGAKKHEGIDISYLKNSASGADFGRSVAAEASGKALGKQAHTRWIHWTSLLDVKALTEVRQVRVFLKNEGGDRLGPNWQTGFRNAIANWTSQSKGTAISFIETSNINNADVVVRAALGLGTKSYMLWINSGPLVGRIPQYGGEGSSSVDIVVNAGYEHIGPEGVPIQEKTRIGMAALVNIFNIGWIDTEGWYWNYGDYTYIPGTVQQDGNAWTPGSSILTNATSQVSTPVMTAGDQHLFRTLYPIHGVTGKHSNYSMLAMVGKESYNILRTYMRDYQIEGDTVVYTTLDGRIFRRIGFGGETQIWPASGSSGDALHFVHNKGYYFVITTAGRAYTRTPTGSWVMQYSSGMSFTANKPRLDGEKAYLMRYDPWTGVPTIYLKYLVSNPGTWYTEWIGAAAYSISDYQVRNGILAVADNGNLWAKQDGVYNWVQLHANWYNGHAQRIIMSDNLIAYYRVPWGSGVGYASVVIGGLFGPIHHIPDPMYGSEDMDACGDKFAFIQEGAYLRVNDYGTWTVHEHYLLPGHTTNTAQVRLSGGTCEYVTIIRTDNSLWAKYGVSLATTYFPYWWGVESLWQRP